MRLTMGAEPHDEMTATKKMQFLREAVRAIDRGLRGDCTMRLLSNKTRKAIDTYSVDIAFAQRQTATHTKRLKAYKQQE